MPASSPMVEFEQLSLYSPISSDDALESVFIQALRAALKQEHIPEVNARFYPYAGLSSTIRMRGGRIYARVSDILIGSPREVLYALSCILVAKLYRLTMPKTHERTYREHTRHQSVLDASNATRRARGYKITTGSRGKVYDLAELFRVLNKRYFSEELEKPLLSWSPGKSRRVLGHHDHVHNAIIISTTLDSESVPRFVVEYVLYHEMLHVKHPPSVVSARTIYHGRAFREEERRFEKFEEAVNWLERLARPARARTRRRQRRA